MMVVMMAVRACVCVRLLCLWPKVTHVFCCNVCHLQYESLKQDLAVLNELRRVTSPANVDPDNRSKEQTVCQPRWLLVLFSLCVWARAWGRLH